MVIAMTVCIYWVCVFVLPRLDLLQSLRESYPWISSGNVSQFSFLISSLILMRIFGKGNWWAFGFRGAGFSPLIRAVLATVVIESGLFLLGMVVTSALVGPQGGGGGGGGAGSSEMPSTRGMLKLIVSVWVIASTCEEVFYRGLIQSLLDPLKRYGFRLFRVWISLPVAVCALMFGLGHLCLLGRFPGVFLVQIIVSCTALGLIAGYYREKTGSLLPAVLAHATANIVGWSIPSIMTQIMPT